MTDKTLHIKPAEGRVIVYPQSRERLPAEGAIVPASTYWLRRVADGDVCVIEPKPRKKATEPAAESRSDA